MSVVDQVALAAAESAAASAVTASNAAAAAVAAAAGIGGGPVNVTAQVNSGNFTPVGSWNWAGATVSGLALGTIDYNALINKPTIPTTLAQIADTAARVAFLPAERTKLTGIAALATANSTDAQLRDRTTHTGIEPLAGLRPGTVLTAAKDPTTGFWPASWTGDGTVPVYTGGANNAGVRPTARGDIKVMWTGAAPPPGVVTTGTAGARDKTGGALGDLWVQEP